MTPQEIYVETAEVIDDYKARLDQYSLQQFQFKPAPDRWSIGEVYSHLIRATHLYHLRMVDRCLANLDNANEQPKPHAKAEFDANELAPVKVKIASSPGYDPPMPDSIDKVKKDIEATVNRLLSAREKLITDPESGKTEHPTYGFIDAKQWYQLIGMHWKHHLMQIEELDTIIQSQTV
jgi:hypothetical protein